MTSVRKIRPADRARAKQRRDLEKQRRDLEFRYLLDDAIGRIGYDVVRAIILAVRSRTEKPLRSLPPPMRKKVLEAFRATKPRPRHVVVEMRR